MIQKPELMIVGRLGKVDLSGLSWRRVHDTVIVGASPYWKPPRHLRWLPMSWEDRARGEFLVAQGQTSKRNSYWFFRECEVCGGYYLASRYNSTACSGRCRSERSRHG